MKQGFFFNQKLQRKNEIRMKNSHTHTQVGKINELFRRRTKNPISIFKIIDIIESEVRQQKSKGKNIEVSKFK